MAWYMWWLVCACAARSWAGGGAGGVAGGVAGGGAGVGAGSSCGLAEHACRAGGCVRLDRYCDGHADCVDHSDEPPHCSVCNRTYYGRLGATYSLQLGGEEESPPRVPFLCHLTLTAGGGAHGDLVQLMFDEFRLGRYEAGALDGCPDGYMQLSELGRPFTGGSWCGESAGYAVYYSETSTVTVSVKLFRARLGTAFHFRMRYKFLSQREAIVRFGTGLAALERGAVSPGTYCTRTFEECHRKSCRLQSPNYPGMYPRNVSCYWSLRQKDIPTCKHAMISVRQEAAHKMQIKRSISMASVNKTGREVRAWRECTGERDRLIFYDGASTDDAVLLEYCGGDWLPPVVSRSSEMLVAFHSSPYSAPLHPPAGASRERASPVPPLRGFELDVDVIFADSDSLDYAREPRRCEFHVKASSAEEEGHNTTGGGAGSGAGRGRRGRLRAPAHTLPPGTTCTWTFHGRDGDLIWIYFSSYSQRSLVDSRRTEVLEGGSGGGGEDGGDGVPRRGAARASAGLADTSRWAQLRELVRARTPPTRASTSTAAPSVHNGTCPTTLRIWDGGGEGEPEARLLGRYCSAPAVCARAALANSTRAPRACGPRESYVSSGPALALAVQSARGTATQPLRFALHYEFIDTRLAGQLLTQGEPRAEPALCARLVTEPGDVLSPRNVLWFGRGGARRLRCVYRLQAPPLQRVELTVLSAGLGARTHCVTRPHHHTGRPTCVQTSSGVTDDDDDWLDSGDMELAEDDRPRVAQLRIYESPWPGYRVPVACVCDNSSLAEGLVAGGVALELVLAVSQLHAREDARQLHFAARWLAVPPSSSTVDCAAARRLPPPGRRVHLRYPYESAAESVCGETPFLLEARGNRSVFLRVWGEALVTPTPTVDSQPASEEPRCHTANRLYVYAMHPTRLVKAICPHEEDSEQHVIHMFSENWYAGSGSKSGRRGDGSSLLVVWSGRVDGLAAFSWMEVWPAAVREGDNSSRPCPHSCGELRACASAELWCDGVTDCPRGEDERGQCGGALRLLVRLGGARVAGGAAAAGLAAALCVLAAVARRGRGAQGGVAGRDKPAAAAS